MDDYSGTLLAERSRRRLRQRDIAKSLGLNPQTIVDIERGRIGVDKPTYTRLLDAIHSLSTTPAGHSEV